MSSGRQSGICAREEHSLEEILFIVCDRFDVAAQQTQDDIWELIMQLEQAELRHSKRRGAQMDQQKKAEYVKPALVKHELLRDVTAIQLSRVVDQTPR